MADAHKNFSYGTVATAPSPATSGLTLALLAGQCAAFPAPPFQATVGPIGQQPVAGNAEIITVVSIVADVITMRRAQEGSVARAIAVGDQVAATITQRTLEQLEGRLVSDADLIRTGYSRYLPDEFEIQSGDVVEIAHGAILEIG